MADFSDVVEELRKANTKLDAIKAASDPSGSAAAEDAREESARAARSEDYLKTIAKAVSSAGGKGDGLDPKDKKKGGLLAGIGGALSGMGIGAGAAMAGMGALFAGGGYLLKQIAEFVNNDEVIVNMFGGVGMFSIIAAKMKKCTVFNIDINPFATKLCKKNIAINRLVGNVISIHGDASQVINSQLENKSDRTLMLLPEKSDEFLDSAILSTKSGGIIHYYSHIHADKKSDAAKLSEQHYMQITPVKSTILGSKIVRPVGPRFYQTVVDVKIKK